MSEVNKKTGSMASRAATVALLGVMGVMAPTGLLAQDAAPAPAPAESAKGILTKAGSFLEFYGFLRIDALYDSKRMSDTQIAQWVNPAGGANDDPDFTMHGRLTRLGVNLKGQDLKDLWDAKLTGTLEIDFYDFDTSDSRNRIRMRKALGKVAWKNLSFQFGQDADVISPLMPAVNADMVNWNAGNLGDRRPQFRTDMWTEMGDTTLKFQQSFGLTGAVSGVNRDGVQPTDGESSGLPATQLRLAAETALYSFGEKNTKAKAELGLWGHYAREKTDTPVAGSARHWFTTYAMGLDISLPLFWEDKLKLVGEVWTGKNLADVRGGIGQHINTQTGDEIRSRGGWAQLEFKANSNFTFYGGFSIDDPIDTDVHTGGRLGNQMYYLAAIAKFGSFTTGLEAVDWTTRHSGAARGESNRYRLYFSYSF